MKCCFMYPTHYSLNYVTSITKLILLIVCDVLSDIANGGAITIGTGVGDTAIYYCDYGYDLIGDGTVTCQSSGNWSGSPPTCEG